MNKQEFLENTFGGLLKKKKRNRTKLQKSKAAKAKIINSKRKRIKLKAIQEEANKRATARYKMKAILHADHMEACRKKKAL